MGMAVLEETLLRPVGSPTDCATKLAVLADATRLAVLEVLLAGPRNVKQINQSVGIAQNLLSHHLRVLREAGLVSARRVGKGVLYALAEGVGAGRSHQSLNLGCCKLTFQDPPLGGKR